MKITVPVQLDKVFELYYSTKAKEPKQIDINRFNAVILERLHFIWMFKSRYDTYTSLGEPKEIKSVEFHTTVKSYEPFGGHAAFEVDYVGYDNYKGYAEIEVDWFNEESIRRLRDILLDCRVSKAKDRIKNYQEEIKKYKNELAQIAAIKKEDEPDLFSDEIMSQIETDGINYKQQRGIKL